ncbi:MAG TPA: ECF-type sigma factor [Phycisphaerae bacterium]|nr:ECF-type sigma factor [Phycisphaerae bacterium]
MSEITRILAAAREGDARAADELLPAVYHELRRLAAQRLAREAADETLEPTALVHEVYLRLVGGGRADWKSRAYFFAAAAEAMRRILIERARQKQRLKRGGGRQRVELDEADLITESDSIGLLALDEALDRLAAENPVKAELVKLRYFAGLTVQQSADVLGISRATADRYWLYARAWLYNDITEGDDSAGA